jgi:hypothetical protein
MIMNKKLQKHVEVAVTYPSYYYRNRGKPKRMAGIQTEIQTGTPHSMYEC